MSSDLSCGDGFCLARAPPGVAWGSCDCHWETARHSSPEPRPKRRNLRSFHRSPDRRDSGDSVATNALNALLAVIRWKKIVGFYDDLEHEHNTIYLIDGNTLINEDEHA
jgi:hypothetical protein